MYQVMNYKELNKNLNRLWLAIFINSTSILILAIAVIILVFK